MLFFVPSYGRPEGLVGSSSLAKCQLLFLPPGRILETPLYAVTAPFPAQLRLEFASLTPKDSEASTSVCVVGSPPRPAPQKGASCFRAESPQCPAPASLCRRSLVDGRVLSLGSRGGLEFSALCATQVCQLKNNADHSVA